MNNFLSEGNTLPLTAPYDVAAGGGFLVGQIFAIAVCAALSGNPVDGKRVGEVTLPKAAGAIAAGAKVYWDDAAKLATGTASTNKLIGAASLAALTGDATVAVILIPAA